MLGEYELIEEIADYGLSTLYRAKKISKESNMPSLTYMIKKYHADVSEELLENEHYISQYLEETCPFSVAVPILETIFHEGNRYVVMQFRKNGLFLNELIDVLESNYGPGRIPLIDILEIIQRILLSLQRLHEYFYEGEKRGYLHLDLNPGNIFFESSQREDGKWGEVKFIDFSTGVEIVNKDSILRTRRWNCVSTGYSAPEICSSIYSHILPATDLYSVCMCMLRMMNGEIVADEEDINPILVRFTRGYDGFVQIMLERIVECSICRPSYYRYQNAREMSHALDELIFCIREMEKGNYILVLEKCYEYTIPIKFIFSQHRSFCKKGLCQSILDLKKALIQTDIHYSKCFYLYEGLYNIAQRIDCPENMKQLLLESGLSCCNSTGHTKEALQIYEEFFNLNTNYTMGSYFTAKLRYSVTLLDCYEIENAFLTVQEVIDCMEAMRRVVGQNNVVRFTELGRAYSAAGTYLAFGHRNNAMDYYEKALAEFGEDQDNCDITFVKILHYSIDQNNQLLYEKYIKKLLKDNDNSVQGQIKKAMGNKYSPYKLLIVLKGIYQFYRKNIDQGMVAEIQGFVEETVHEKNDYPNQLIDKYLALLAYESGDIKTYQKYKKYALSRIKNGRIFSGKELTIMMLISYQSIWIFNQIEGKEDENKKLLEQVCKQAENDMWMKLKKQIKKDNSLEHILYHEYS